MSELEELKKEIKLLREKIEKLEATPKVEYHYHYITYPQPYPTTTNPPLNPIPWNPTII